MLTEWEKELEGLKQMQEAGQGMAEAAAELVQVAKELEEKVNWIGQMIHESPWIFGPGRSAGAPADPSRN
jgi:hypothetical protein